MPTPAPATFIAATGAGTDTCNCLFLLHHCEAAEAEEHSDDSCEDEDDDDDEFGTGDDDGEAAADEHGEREAIRVVAMRELLLIASRSSCVVDIDACKGGKSFSGPRVKRLVTVNVRLCVSTFKRRREVWCVLVSITAPIEDV